MLAPVTVRLAQPADAVEIAAMSREYIEYGLPWRWTPQRIARAIANPDTNVAVAGDSGALAGFGIMSYRDEDAHLLLFAVRQAQRRRGIGRAIVEWLEAVARTAGMQRIRLEVRRENVAGRSFYSELGYHERDIQPAMYGAAVDGVRLEKWLRPRG